MIPLVSPVAMNNKINKQIFIESNIRPYYTHQTK